MRCPFSLCMSEDYDSRLYKKLTDEVDEKEAVTYLQLHLDLDCHHSKHILLYEFVLRALVILAMSATPVVVLMFDTPIMLSLVCSIVLIQGFMLAQFIYNITMGFKGYKKVRSQIPSHTESQDTSQ